MFFPLTVHSDGLILRATVALVAVLRVGQRFLDLLFRNVCVLCLINGINNQLEAHHVSEGPPLAVLSVLFFVESGWSKHCISLTRAGLSVYTDSLGVALDHFLHDGHDLSAVHVLLVGVLPIHITEAERAFGFFALEGSCSGNGDDGPLCVNIRHEGLPIDFCTRRECRSRLGMFLR